MAKRVALTILSFLLSVSIIAPASAQIRSNKAELAKKAAAQKSKIALEAKFAEYHERATQLIFSMMPICGDVMQQTFKPKGGGKEIRNSLRPISERDVVVTYRMSVREADYAEKLNYNAKAYAKIDYYVKYNNWQNLYIRSWITPDYGMTYQWGLWEAMRGPSNYYSTTHSIYHGTLNLTLHQDDTTKASIRGGEWSDIPDYYKEAINSHIETGKFRAGEYDIQAQTQNWCRSDKNGGDVKFHNWIGDLFDKYGGIKDIDF